MDVKGILDFIKEVLQSWYWSLSLLLVSVGFTVLDHYKFERLKSLPDAFFIAALVLIPVCGVNLLRLWLAPIIRKRREAAGRQERWASLGADHHAIIIKLYNQPNGLQFDATNALIVELERNLMIFRTSSIGQVHSTGGVYTFYGLQPWVREGLSSGKLQIPKCSINR